MVIDLETPCCGLVRYGKSIFIGCMGNQVYYQRHRCASHPQFDRPLRFAYVMLYHGWVREYSLMILLLPLFNWQFNCYHIKGKKSFSVYLDSHITQVRFQIIRNARIENVGKSQPCMVSKP